MSDILLLPVLPEEKEHIFLCLYRVIDWNIFCESLGELKRAVETLACSSYSHSIPYFKILTEPLQAVSNIIEAQGKIICIFDKWKKKKMSGILLLPVFSEEKENIFLCLYRVIDWNTCESLGELKRAMETLACGSYFHSISYSHS